MDVKTQLQEIALSGSGYVGGQLGPTETRPLTKQRCPSAAAMGTAWAVRLVVTLVGQILVIGELAQDVKQVCNADRDRRVNRRP